MTETSLVLLAYFWFPSLVGRAKDKIDEKNLSSWKLLDDFRRRLANAQTAVPTRERRPGGPERLLLEEDYFSLMLFGLFNPVLNSMRGLCLCGEKCPNHRQHAMILRNPRPLWNRRWTRRLKPTLR